MMEHLYVHRMCGFKNSLRLNKILIGPPKSVWLD